MNPCGAAHGACHCRLCPLAQKMSALKVCFQQFNASKKQLALFLEKFWKLKKPDQDALEARLQQRTSTILATVTLKKLTQRHALSDKTKSMEAKLAALTEYRKHLHNQFCDRLLDAGDVTAVIEDELTKAAVRDWVGVRLEGGLLEDARGNRLFLNVLRQVHACYGQEYNRAVSYLQALAANSFWQNAVLPALPWHESHQLAPAGPYDLNEDQKAKGEEPAGASPPPSKQVCTAWERGLKKLPGGDLTLDADLDARPASLVIENLASGRPTDKVNLSHLESWYEECSKLLGKPQKFAHTPCEIKSSMDGLLTGSINCEAAALDQVKGWTRSSVLALLLIAAAEYDLGDPFTMDKLQPLISVNMDTAKQSYRNLCLSYRGSERQPPNLLQLALRFSQIIEMRDKQGVHNKLWTPEQRLQEVVDEFNETSGLQQKHRVDAERFRSLLNLISGSSKESRQVLRQHLNHHKWREAFSVEQFKGSRWLVGATPKSTCPPDMKQALTVTPESQRMHFELIVHTFVEGGRKLRPSARSRTRAAPEVFDRHADYACIFATI
ncbi:unnamed protein product [Effrenium voratum]|uniref:Uncharacterized protein n=1 Tax=Effrenium voratum TaxID=2562239 RepID=A0AA36JQN6_9DINO|nr:unnamed protein product [Effrenium voratum]